MQKYVEVLESHEVDVDTLVTMDDQDLKEIGISTFGKFVVCAGVTFPEKYNRMTFLKIDIHIYR